jgi:hypothetical protein
MGPIRTLALLAATFCACAAALLLGMAGPALASSSAIALDGPQNGTDPLVQYDPVSKTTFIAWSDIQAPDNGVELCVLPAAATACEGGGPVLLSISSAQNSALTGDNTVGLGGLVVEANGDVVVIGTPVSTGSVAWESTADGSAFLAGGQGLQNGGQFISPVSLFYTFGNVAPVGNTDVGLLNDYGDTFSDSAFSGPESPPVPNSNANQGNGGLYPRKALSTDGPEVAAEAAPAPAAAGTEIVVGVGDNYAGPNTTLPGCVNSQGSGFGVDLGSINSGSNAAGTLNQGIPGYGLLACAAEEPVLTAGVGEAGIGVLENEGDGNSSTGSTYTVDYRPFVTSATGGNFGSPVQLLSTDGDVGELDLVDDSGDGVYAEWQKDGTFVDYSANGGVTWGPPVQVPEPTAGEISDPVITGIGAGYFSLAYDANPGPGTETFLATYSYQQLLLAPTTLGTSQHSGTSTGASISIPAGTVGEGDTAVISGTNAASASGTVDFGLYANASCTGTPTFAGAATAAAGKASITDSSATGLAVGKYYWKAAYVGDALNDPSLSSCGSEILSVGPAATIPATATATTTSVTLSVTCSTLPCTVTVTITIPAAGTAFASAHTTAAKRTVTLATGRFSIAKSGKHALKLKLTSRGRALLKRDRKLGTTLLLKTKTKHGTFSSTHALKITRR